MSPPPAHDHAARRARLADRLPEAGLDALLVTDLTNLRYLTGFTGSAGRLLVRADGSHTLITDGRYRDQAEAEVPDLPRIITRGDDWVDETIAGTDRVGLEAHRVPWATARSLQERLAPAEAVPAGQLVEELRAIKDSSEIAALERACALTAQTWEAVLAWIQPGVTEREVARFAERTMVDLGADAPAFPPTVAGGPNGARPHHKDGRRTLVEGDLITVDMGARVDGYCADMTRLVSLGEPGPELGEVVEVVAAAQAAAVAAVADGVAARDVDAAARDLIAQAGHGEAFVHGTGHGVGLDLHEAPRLGTSSDATLAARMAVTVEPGIYLSELGGARIEDLVVVTDDGCRALTTPDRTLAVR